MNGQPVTAGMLRRVLETVVDDTPVYVEVGRVRAPMLSVGTSHEVVIGGSARGTELELLRAIEQRARGILAAGIEWSPEWRRAARRILGEDQP